MEKPRPEHARTSRLDPLTDATTKARPKEPCGADPTLVLRECATRVGDERQRGLTSIILRTHVARDSLGRRRLGTSRSWVDRDGSAAPTTDRAQEPCSSGASPYQAAGDEVDLPEAAWAAAERDLVRAVAVAQRSFRPGGSVEFGDASELH